jgi:hypothetical protein
MILGSSLLGVLLEVKVMDLRTLLEGTFFFIEIITLKFNQ